MFCTWCSENHGTDCKFDVPLHRVQHTFICVNKIQERRKFSLHSLHSQFLITIRGLCTPSYGSSTAWLEPATLSCMLPVTLQHLGA